MKKEIKPSELEAEAQRLIREGKMPTLGCTEYKRCRYLPRPGVPLGSQPVLTCEWADKTKTLSTNPACLETAKAEAQ